MSDRMAQQPMTPEAAYAHAMAAVQANLPKIEKSATAKVETRQGPGYSYSYADLAQITDKVLPLLAANGLSWSCRPTLFAFEGATAPVFVLEYELLHLRGVARHGLYPLPTGGTPQALGSAITYGRRYCLAAVVGIVGVDDDDAAAAEAERQAMPLTAQRRQAQADAIANRTSARRQPELPGEPKPISNAQRNRMMGLFGKLDIQSREARVALLGDLVSRTIGSSNELSHAESDQIIEVLDRATKDENPMDVITAAIEDAARRAQDAAGARSGPGEAERTDGQDEPATEEQS